MAWNLSTGHFRSGKIADILWGKWLSDCFVTTSEEVKNSIIGVIGLFYVDANSVPELCSQDAPMVTRVEIATEIVVVLDEIFAMRKLRVATLLSS